MSVSGILFIDKPAGLTSHDVVARVRRLLATKKVGHAGTLDPMATGLLTLGVGQSTRLLTYMVGLDKKYYATIRLGSATVTDDREGETTSVATAQEIAAVQDEQIRAAVQKLTGKIEQVPSSVSAIKVQGKRAYDLVRSGAEVELKSRAVEIFDFTINKITRDELNKFIDLDVSVHCSSGTYIRALARDIGNMLGVGGHLTELRRTAVGSFKGGQKLDGQELDELIITPPAEVATKLFKTIVLDEQQAIDLLHGKRFHVEHEDAETLAALTSAAKGEDAKLLGIVSVKNQKLKSITNFAQENGQG